MLAEFWIKTWNSELPAPEAGLVPRSKQAAMINFQALVCVNVIFRIK
jgi:hypothetical protein